MPTVVKSLVAGFAGLALSVARPATATAQEEPWRGLKASQLAPAFSLKPINGGPAVGSTEVFKERGLTLLILWDSYCPECLKAVAQCQSLYEKSDSLGVTVLSINFDRDNLAGVRAFIKGEGITFPVLSDPQCTTPAQYGAEGYDFSFFVVDRKETVRYVCYDKPPDVIELIGRELNKLLEETSLHRSPEEEPDSRGVTVPQDEGPGEE